MACRPWVSFFICCCCLEFSAVTAVGNAAGAHVNTAAEASSAGAASVAVVLGTRHSADRIVQEGVLLFREVKASLFRIAGGIGAGTDIVHLTLHAARGNERRQKSCRETPGNPQRIYSPSLHSLILIVIAIVMVVAVVGDVASVIIAFNMLLTFLNEQSEAFEVISRGEVGYDLIGHKVDFVIGQGILTAARGGYVPVTGQHIENEHGTVLKVAAFLVKLVSEGDHILAVCAVYRHNNKLKAILIANFPGKLFQLKLFIGVQKSRIVADYLGPVRKGGDTERNTEQADCKATLSQVGEHRSRP